MFQEPWRSVRAADRSDVAVPNQAEWFRSAGLCEAQNHQRPARAVRQQQEWGFAVQGAITYRGLHACGDVGWLYLQLRRQVPIRAVGGPVANVSCVERVAEENRGGVQQM